MNKKKLLNLRGILETVSLYVNNQNIPEDLRSLCLEVAKNALDAVNSEIKKG